MALLNRFGYQLYPVVGGEQLSEEGWMFTTDKPKSRSEERFYTFKPGDDNLGREKYSDDFTTHAHHMASQKGE